MNCAKVIKFSEARAAQVSEEVTTTQLVQSEIVSLGAVVGGSIGYADDTARIVATILNALRQNMIVVGR